ncbi:hypothetical protein HDC93_005123 [Streptomyces sp. AK010]|nr:hypothetical protein [Streptomyces sp. AK010]
MCLLHAGDDLLHVDPQPGERIGLGLRQPGPPPRLTQRLAHGLPSLTEPESGEREGPTTALPVQQSPQQVLRLHAPPASTAPLHMRVSALHHTPGVFGEPLEHQCLPYFLCTACLLTPSSVAISCHDQP